MAIEDRARVALSIAFTASIVAYPDLPPDIPPRAGVDAAFIGAPFAGSGIASAASAAQAQGITLEKIAGLPAFLEATVPALMEQGHVPGAAVAVVHEGRIVLLRGDGQARLDSGARVDASRTLFRIGSVSKVFAAVAALQLVEAGKLDLQRDIRQYVPDIPLRYGATTHQLLTHTTGLLERFAGAYTDSPSRLQPLSDHLRRFTPAQDRPPGHSYSYSNYNTALTGLLVEELSGGPYADYLAGRVFRPLKMAGTTAHQPPEPNLTGDLARGYRWSGGRQEPLPYRYTQTGPAGGISTTAADMGRFMLMLLGDGSVDGERILSPESVKTMLAPQYTPDPRIPARAYEMAHWAAHGQHLLHKDGTLGDQIGVMLLAPADRFGIFIASNAEPGVSLGNQVLEPLLTYLVGPEPPAPPPAPLPDAVQRAPRFAGSYRSYSRTRGEMSQVRSLMPILQSRVVAESDGAIRWQGRRWREVEPRVFRRVDSMDYIVFRESDRGDIVELHTWGATYERVGWLEQTLFQAGVLATCVIAFLAYPLSRGIRARGRRRAPAGRSCDRPAPGGRVARGCALFVALTNLAFVAGLVASQRDLGTITPLPLPMVLLLSLPIASLAATAFLPALAARAWRDDWWTRGERLGYSTFVVCAVTFMTFLNYWKLLGVRY